MRAYEIQINGRYQGWMLAKSVDDAIQWVRTRWSGIESTDQVHAIAC